ncbi:hypothetical protein QWY85_19095 [Neolewinella lacunae]|uniref:Lipoprotein n=1 Tax=Neolewinella lacunae TaxID=1517758 RepID=A0A923PP28_9BACT|nr:hypothetical protein [Neolewinella lacunae]MBC6994864.1 hypothetical protein [Neolewinella lacunae]MDN3636784.1 hypothetical protein [Neolewinella lacunae]
MKNYLILLAALLTFSGCPDDEEYIVRISNPQDTPCGVGFTYDDARETCDCPPENKTIGDLDCFELPAGYYFSSMTECYYDQGMAFTVAADTVHPDAQFFGNFYRTRREIYSPRTVSRPVGVATSLITFYTREIGPNRDSILFDFHMSGVYEPEERIDGLYVPKMVFKGVSNRADSIYGKMYFGFGGEPVKFDQVLDSCQMVFILPLQ